MFDKEGISRELIFFYSYDELMQGVEYLHRHKGEPERRNQGASYYIPYQGEMETELGMYQDHKLLIERHILDQNGQSLKRGVRGKVAYSGKIRGVVKCINNLALDKDKFCKNDILVTGMTRPEYVPLMHMASAIVTDEGGVTCHAAVLARELKKPCIIGTKVATQVLKDGDRVEVDAVNGIVQVL